MQLRGWLSGSLLLLAGCGACDETRACTAIGCEDNVHFTIRVPGNAWPSGSYRLEFKTAAATHTCDIMLPRDLPELSGPSAALPCSRELHAFFSGVSACADATSVPKGQTCGTLPDQWFIEGLVNGAPASIHARIERDGTELLDEERALSYEDFEPNGPGCGPSCRSGEMALELP